MKDDWRSPRVGDRVRIVRLPSDWEKPNWRVDPSLRQLYRRLIDRKWSVRVFWIDEFQQPWIQGRTRRPNGIVSYWSLAIADDSWTRVRHRVRASEPR
jgi:hypothetical protein